jgi:hypothetical protein
LVLVVNTMHTTSPDRKTVFLLAAIAGCHVHTARRALVEGVDEIKGDDLKERLRGGLEQLARMTAEARATG